MLPPFRFQKRNETRFPFRFVSVSIFLETESSVSFPFPFGNETETDPIFEGNETERNETEIRKNVGYFVPVRQTFNVKAG